MALSQGCGPLRAVDRTAISSSAGPRGAGGGELVPTDEFIIKQGLSMIEMSIGTLPNTWFEPTVEL